MLTILFLFLFFGVFGKLLWLAIRAAWGISKILLGLVFLPIVLIGLLISGLLSLAFPILAIVGIYTIIKTVTA